MYSLTQHHLWGAQLRLLLALVQSTRAFCILFIVSSSSCGLSILVGVCCFLWRSGILLIFVGSSILSYSTSRPFSVCCPIVPSHFSAAFISFVCGRGFQGNPSGIQSHRLKLSVVSCVTTLVSKHIFVETCQWPKPLD